MTDTNTSGASFAPAAPTQAPAASAETPAGSFGSTRGSGLARGKRPSGAATPSTIPVKADFKPTAVEIITPEREYKNPFASPEPVSAPAEEPAKVEIPEVAPVAPVQAAEAPVAQAAEPAPQPVQEPVVERSEIQILPPAESVRPAVSWESPSAARGDADAAEPSDRPQRDDRPTFRADRREDRQGGPRAEGGEPRRDSFQRQPRDPREPRQPRDPREARQPRDPRDYPQYEQRPRGEERRAPAPAPKGFFGWLKSLFAGSKPAETPTAADSPADQFGGGHRHRRRHRGGRGGQGYRGDRFAPGGGSPQGGEQENRGGERYEGGPRRRRHRGGRGRDRGGDNNSQGQQGGGAI